MTVDLEQELPVLYWEGPLMRRLCSKLTLPYLRELEVHLMDAAILKTVRDLGLSGTLYTK